MRSEESRAYFDLSLFSSVIEGRRGSHTVFKYLPPTRHFRLYSWVLSGVLEQGARYLRKLQTGQEMVGVKICLPRPQQLRPNYTDCKIGRNIQTLAFPSAHSTPHSLAGFASNSTPLACTPLMMLSILAAARRCRC